jgi:tetratricopeptide (TPR) repeat protein
VQSNDATLKSVTNSVTCDTIPSMVRLGDGTLAVEDVEGTIFRCEGIEIDSSLGCVRRAGEEQHLRQQSFHVLLYLLERRQRVVTREELIASFWSGIAVTDNAVAQCIAEIRKALGDDPREPRFIKTTPKVGYRFIASVTEQHLTKETPPVQATAAVSGGRSRNISLALVLAGCCAAVVIWAVIASRSPHQRVEVTLPQVAGRKALAVMYFENQSASPQAQWLSEGLADMFIADLAHFEHLTVLSRPQLQLLLNRVGHRPESTIQLEDALDIARRSHAERILMGSFMTFGEKTLVTVRLYETAHGQLLASEKFSVDRPADIITQVDLLSPKLAAQLVGAPKGAMKQTGLGKVMTNNVEAYRYYSLGVSKAQAFQNAEAISLLRKAVQLDPGFAMAYARIGYAYSVTDFLPDKGLPFLEKATSLSDHLTAKDRLYVTAWDAIARKDYPTAIKMLQQVVEGYPLETEAHARLARLLISEERPIEAIAILQRGLAIDPDDGDLYNVLGICFLSLRRYDEAVAAHRRYVELLPNQPNSHDSLGMSLQQAGRFDSAVADYDIALSLDPEFEPSIIHLGDVFAQEGRYNESIRQYERYIQITSSDAARAVGYGSIAQVYRRRHDLTRAAQAAREELRLAKGAVWNSLLAALDRGDTAKAAALRSRLIENVPYPVRGSRNELRSYDFYLGTLALRDHKPDEAIARFQDALRHLPPSSGLDLYEDCLANAYLQLNRFDDAIAEYKRILRLNPNTTLPRHIGTKACYGRQRIPISGFCRFGRAPMRIIRKFWMRKRSSPLCKI